MRIVGSLVRLLPRNSWNLQAERLAHALAKVPLKKRGVDGFLPENYLDNKAVLLYFSAGWCGSCKFLTPKVKKFYDAVKDDKTLEIVWISKDKEADHQIEYYEKNLPAWPYVPFGDENIMKLTKQYKTEVIPALKLINANGDVVNDRARADIEAAIKANPMDTYQKWKKLLGL
ncbi:unnamed protein product [Caenorhabditis bovis]|uniref:protein-disulfide reductase n=1 Tax=Caenorhabditis bovis TaxID=2654633 RepID=A0A8S1FDC5_9PELO|nr:unnamed protein product [Caenorhabditis bovis]